MNQRPNASTAHNPVGKISDRPQTSFSRFTRTVVPVYCRVVYYSARDPRSPVLETNCPRAAEVGRALRECGLDIRMGRVLEVGR